MVKKGTSEHLGVKNREESIGEVKNMRFQNFCVQIFI